MSLSSASAVFEYGPLTEEGAIRLILLQPSQDSSAPIKCSLKHSKLSHYQHELVDHYIALSYVWGDPNDTKTVFVDGKPVIVTANLASAFYHLREQEPGRVLCLWADAICINQADISEKSRQVQQMGAIYHTAHHTVIYLGQSTKNTDIAFNNLQLIQQENKVLGRKMKFDNLNSEELKNICNTVRSHILSRPWFKRVWVFQELVLSHDPWIQCGNKRMKWDKFYDIFSGIERECGNATSQALDTFTVERNSEVDALKTLFEMQARRRAFHYNINLHDKGSHYNSLLDLLSLRRGLGASDIRDFVFAHLGLAADYQRDPNELYVDYTMSCTQVFIETARYMIQQGDLDKVLSQALNVRAVNRLPDLPSWAPDWSLQFETKLSSPWPHTCATKYVDAAISFSTRTHLPIRLICKGRYIGKIAALSRTLSYNDKSPDDIEQACNKVWKNTSSTFAHAETWRDESRHRMLISLYHEMLKLFGSDLQYLKAPPELDLSKFFHDYDSWMLRFLKDRNTFKSYCVHPIALITLFILGRFNYANYQPKLDLEIERAQQDALFLQGRRVGFVHFSAQTREFTEMRLRCPLGLDKDTLPYRVPFGLFPDYAKKGDMLCLIDGFPKLYVCRPVEKTAGEDDRKHLIIIGECSMNTQKIYILDDVERINREVVRNRALEDFPATDLVFH